MPVRQKGIASSADRFRKLNDCRCCVIVCKPSRPIPCSSWLILLTPCVRGRILPRLTAATETCCAGAPLQHSGARTFERRHFSDESNDRALDVPAVRRGARHRHLSYAGLFAGRVARRRDRARRACGGLLLHPVGLHPGACTWGRLRGRARQPAQLPASAGRPPLSRSRRRAHALRGLRGSPGRARVQLQYGPLHAWGAARPCAAPAGLEHQPRHDLELPRLVDRRGVRGLPVLPRSGVRSSQRLRSGGGRVVHRRGRRLSLRQSRAAPDEPDPRLLGSAYPARVRPRSAGLPVARPTAGASWPECAVRRHGVRSRRGPAVGGLSGCHRGAALRAAHPRGEPPVGTDRPRLVGPSPRPARGGQLQSLHGPRAGAEHGLQRHESAGDWQARSDVGSPTSPARSWRSLARSSSTPLVEVPGRRLLLGLLDRRRSARMREAIAVP